MQFQEYPTTTTTSPTPDDGPIPGEVFTPEQQAERAAQWDELLAEAEPAVNLHGERLDQLPPLTLADDLAEIDAAVADGVCSKGWARQARQNVLERHRVEAVAIEDEGSSDVVAAARCEVGATETTGADPPPVELLSLPRRGGPAMTTSAIPAGLAVVDCGLGCHFHIVHEGTGIVLATRRTGAEATSAAQSLCGIAWAWPGPELFRSPHLGATLRRLHEKVA